MADLEAKPDYTALVPNTWHSWRTQRMASTGGYISTPFFWTGTAWTDNSGDDPVMTLTPAAIADMYVYECPATV